MFADLFYPKVKSFLFCYVTDLSGCIKITLKCGRAAIPLHVPTVWMEPSQHLAASGTLLRHLPGEESSLQCCCWFHPQKGSSSVYCEELALLESQHFLHIGIIIEVEKYTFPYTSKHHSFLFGAVMKWSWNL